MIKTNRIASKTIPTPQTFDPDFVAPKTEQTRAERRHFSSLAERVAQSDLSIGNWRWPGAVQDYASQDIRRATVDLYYPYAAGGELLIDMPQYDVDRKACELKAQILRRRGYRYVILYKGIQEYEAMTQLDHCMDRPPPGDAE